MTYLFKVPFGSQVYGLTNNQSDKDFVYIVDDGILEDSLDVGDSEVYTISRFQEQLNNHDVKALELYFYSKEVNEYFDFELNLGLLRSGVSKVVSNAHVKAKKKFIDGEMYTGLKSYYHCIRLLTMFDYLAKHGTFNPSEFVPELSYVYSDIINRDVSSPGTLFAELEKDYKKMLKNLQHSFRIHCPKIK